MLPLKDLNRPFRTPHVNRMLLIVNFIIFVVYWLSTVGIYFPRAVAEKIEYDFTFYPSEVIHGQRLYTLVTSMFMHTD
ncbi:MAG: rhomboid family intramembrane serine protease, partial [Candidatus Bathyarchaeia archaeon]